MNKVINIREEDELVSELTEILDRILSASPSVLEEAAKECEAFMAEAEALMEVLHPYLDPSETEDDETEVFERID